MGKKCKEAKKLRKLTFLRGQVDKVVTDLKPSDGKEFIKFFVDLLANHPEYQSHQNRDKKLRKRKKKKEDEASGELDETESSIIEQADPVEPKVKNPLRDELIFGLTEVLKKIQKRQLIGVIAADPLTIHLQATLFDLCREFNIPFLLSKNLHQISATLGLSRLSCFAFTDKVKESTSICHPLYQTFNQLIGLLSDDKNNRNPCLNPKTVTKEETTSTVGPEFIFDMPPEENFYIPREEISEPIPETVGTTSPKKMDEFININREINHFPPRPFFRDIQLTLPWIGDESRKSQTSSIGKSLFVVKSSINKIEYPLDEDVPFSEPSVVQLPSSGRVREKRKKFKKIKQKPK